MKLILKSKQEVSLTASPVVLQHFQLMKASTD